MVKIDTNDDRYIIKFKRKDKRQNKIDDKFELFRSIVGLHDTNDIFDVHRFTGTHMADPIVKNETTVTDINSFKLPVVIARLSPQQVELLRLDPNVEYVMADRLESKDAETVPWGIFEVKAPDAWSVTNTRGKGAIVAIVDTGCDFNHPDLKANIKVNQSFVPTNQNGMDHDIHGTHVHGTVAAIANTEGVVGVAPFCTLWNLRVAQDTDDPATDGLFPYASTLEAIEYAKENGAHIVNMSFGSYAPYEPQSPREILIKDGYDNKGMVFFGAAGNDAITNVQHSPSNNYGVNEISSIDENENLSGFSNSGPNTDYCCPGGQILSTSPGNRYIYLDGTSMATPHASGIAALAYAAYKDDNCNPVYLPTGTPKNKVVERVFDLSVNKLGKFTGLRINQYGKGLPEADKIVSILMGIQV